MRPNRAQCERPNPAPLGVMEVTAIEANEAAMEAMAVEAALVTGVATGVASQGATDTTVVMVHTLVDIMEDIQVMERMADTMAGLQVDTMEDIQVDIKGETSNTPATTLTPPMAMVDTMEGLQDPKLKLKVPALLLASTVPSGPSVPANHKPVPQPAQANIKGIKVCT